MSWNVVIYAEEQILSAEQLHGQINERWKVKGERWRGWAVSGYKGWRVKGEGERVLRLGNGERMSEIDEEGKD